MTKARKRGGLENLVWGCVVVAAFAAGLASGQGDEPVDAVDDGLEGKLAAVRREVKRIDLEAAIGRVPALVAREYEYEALLQQAHAAAGKGEGGVPGMLEKAHGMKLAALGELNDILKKHAGKHAGIA
jgi:hypothetical protein